MTNRIALTAGAATSLTGHVVFGDHGVGAIPLDGEITLAAEGVDPWHGSLSTGAMEAAERLWSKRQHADRLTDLEAIAIARAAFDVDLAFLGLAAAWPSSHVTPIGLGAVVEVTATVTPAQPHEVTPARRATVRFELVDGSTDAAEFTLTDGDEIEVLDHEDLHLHTRPGPDLDALATAALRVLDDALASRRLPPRSYWHLDYSEAPAWEAESGTCGELRVWTTYEEALRPPHRG